MLTIFGPRFKGFRLRRRTRPGAVSHHAVCGLMSIDIAWFHTSLGRGDGSRITFPAPTCLGRRKRLAPDDEIPRGIAAFTAGFGGKGNACPFAVDIGR